MPAAEFSVSTSPACLTAVTRVDSSGLADAAVATGAVAIPVKLPAPDMGTEAQPGPKSDVVDAAAPVAGEDAIGELEAGIGVLAADDDGAEAAGVLELGELLHAAAPTARPAAATDAARMRYCMVTPWIRSVCYSSGDTWLIRCYLRGSVRRPRGRRRTPGQVTVTTTESQPVAPLGNTPASLLVWTAPVPSVARTWRVCRPDEASQGHTHCRQVSVPSAAASFAVCHAP